MFLPSVGNAHGVSAGAKIGCVAFPIKEFRELMVLRNRFCRRCAAKRSASRYRGGFWLATMMVLDGVG